MERSLNTTELIERMERAPLSAWHVKARVVMGSATFFDAFNALSLAFALPALIQLWHISPQQSGFLIGGSYLGQLIGALFFTWLAERFGRVPSAALAVGVMAVMTLGCALAGDFYTLFGCRVLQGIGVGGEMPVAAVYISELSKARGRGKFFLLYELIFPLGLIATGQASTWLVPSLGWRSIFFAGSVPCVVIAFLVARLPESPRWLISKGRLAEAEAIIERIEVGRTSRSARDVLVPLKPAGRPAADQEVRPTRWRELLTGAYRGRTLIVWTLWAATFFIANSLNNWLPSLYSTVYHLELRQALRAASLTNIAQVLVLLVCAFSIDRIGRRNWTVASFAIGGALLAALGISGAKSSTGVMIVSTLSYGVIGSINAVLYLYTPEIYPTRMRAIATGLATSGLRLASAVGPAMVGIMVGAGGIGSVFLMFAGSSVVGIIAAAFMIETRGQRLEDIAP